MDIPKTNKPSFFEDNKNVAETFANQNPANNEGEGPAEDLLGQTEQDKNVETASPEVQQGLGADAVEHTPAEFIAADKPGVIGAESAFTDAEHPSEEKINPSADYEVQDVPDVIGGRRTKVEHAEDESEKQE